MKRTLWLVAGGVAVIGSIAAGFSLAAPNPIVPKSVSSQVTSTIFLPKSADVVTNSQSVKYNKTEKILSYTASYSGATLIISEQPTPESFTDIPQVYEKVVSQMNNYTSFESRDGTVHLTTPTQLKGQQTAVLNTKGTLTFVKPSVNLTTDQWKRFFNTFRPVD